MSRSGRVSRLNVFRVGVSLALVAGAAVLPAYWMMGTGREARGAGEVLPAEALAAESKTVLGLVAQECMSCHNAEDHLGDVVLETYTDAASIRKNRKQWERVITMVGGGAMPPKGQAELPLATRKEFVTAAKAILAWTDPARPDPGRVTLRRLNRAEYDNTVYELLGINFYPSADFPPDDVGAGFDNNGDVLTLSPILMERYVAAAEAVVQESLPEGGTWPIFQKVDAFTPPAGGALFKQTSLGRDKIRQILPGMTLTYAQTGNQAVKTEGDYVYRAFAYFHEGAGLEKPVITLEVDDKVVGELPVTGLGYEQAAFYQARVHLTAGAHKFVVKWVLKEGQEAPIVPFDAAGKVEPPGIHVRWIELAGPRTESPAEKIVMAHKKDAAPRDAAKEVIERFASKAYRRPATGAEVDRLLAFYDEAAKEGADWYDATRQPLTAVLVSPQFLFRVEADDHPEMAGPHAINDYQLASRLSYFLWSSMPDDTLLALAAKNELHTQLEAQVRRMLKDDRAGQLTENFAAQWLHLRMLQKVTPDKVKFPEYTDALKAAMATESLKFFGAVVGEDRSILELLDGNFTYLNQPLAELYGIVDTKGNRTGQAKPVAGGQPIKGPNFVKVELQPGDRGGVLTQASVLTVTSNPGRTSPVKRGKFVLEQLLGEPPPPPPPNVPSLDLDQHAASTGNVRQRMEQHRADPQCAACHLEMDAIGFALENFNPIGKYRAKDDTFEIDARGTLPDGTSFDGAGQLRAMLKGKSDVFTRALTQQMMTYALGRQMQYFDEPAVDKIARAVAADNYRFSRLVIEIVQSDPFRLRRGKDQSDE